MRIEEISLKQIQKMGLEELLALRSFVNDPSEDSWKEVTIGRLWDERIKLEREDVPKSNWPLSLQPVDWMIEVRRTMGLKPMSRERLNYFVSCEILPEMFMMREQLKVKGTPESKWPPELAGEDWEERVWVKHGFPPQKHFPPPVPPYPKAQGSISKDQPPTLEPRTKPETQKGSDWTKSDGYGTILGERDPQWEEILRMKREKNR